MLSGRAAISRDSTCPNDVSVPASDGFVADGEPVLMLTGLDIAGVFMC